LKATNGKPTIAERRTRRRAGLSTLEMVLVLPFLLFIMALMINIGTIASWKVRTLSMARHAVWSTRWPRTGGSDPRPKYWPRSASNSSAGAGDIQELDDPRVDQPVARGPDLYGTKVDEELLDPTRGLRRGSAHLKRDYPLLAKMGAYDLNAKTHLLDNCWQYQRTGLSHNRQRRIPVIYELAKAPPGLANAYVSAVVTLLNAPCWRGLQPLDNDDEFRRYRGSSPDFHPRLQKFCSLDLELAAERVEKLIDKIRGKVERDADGKVISRTPCVAEKMAKAFIGLYKWAIFTLQGRPGTAGEIAQLQAKIDILEKFVQQLQSSDGA